MILFLADGNGFTAIRIFDGQLLGQPGEESYIVYELLLFSGLMKTSAIDMQFLNSAGVRQPLFTPASRSTPACAVSSIHWWPTMVSISATGPAKPF